MTRRSLLAGAAAMPLVATAAGSAEAATVATMVVTPSNDVIAGGLPIFGLGMGYHMEASNTTAWIRYARINTARVWVPPHRFIDDAYLHSGGVTDLSSFDAAKAALRPSPETAEGINWSAIQFSYEHTLERRRTVNHQVGELTRLGLTVLAESDAGGTASESSLWYPADATQLWAWLWRNWQLQYLQAYHLAKSFGVVRFAIQNEPDAHGTNYYIWKRIPNMTAFRRALRFSSDAIRCGVADAAAATGRPMTAIIHAPVITRSTMINKGQGGTGPITNTNIEANTATEGYWGNDTRDDYKGWGRVALETIRTDYRGNQVDYNIFDVWDTHSYGQPSSWYPDEIAAIKHKVRLITGQDLPIVYSEINRYNGSQFDLDPARRSLEYSWVAQEVGHIASTATHFWVGSRGGGLVFFKHAKTEGHGTGFYYVDDDTAPYDIQGATRGAETLRLFSRALVGNVERRATPNTNPPAGVSVYSSYDAARHRHHVLVSSSLSDTIVYELNLATLSPGTRWGRTITIDEVSSRRAGGIARWETVPSDEVITCSQPRDSTWLITIPDLSATNTASPIATQNALIRNGADADRALGGGSLAVQRQTNAPDEITLLRFDPPGPASGTLVRAVLQVYGKVGAGDDICTFLVYARPGWEWSESTITWNSTPYLAPGDALFRGGGDELWPAGQMSVTESLTQHRLDVTDVVEALGAGPITFILVKQPRTSTDSGQNGRRVTLHNRVDPTSSHRPTLRLWTA
ncbi:MAG: DUF7594 domain-containing protein [Micromonosporaceae bacterium]